MIPLRRREYIVPFNFSDFKINLVGLGERVQKIIQVINDNFRYLDKKKLNKLFIRPTDPAKIKGIHLVNKDIWIDTSGDKDKFATISIIQSDNQTIIVSTDDSSYEDDVTLPIGTKFTVTVIADPGYTPGVTNIQGGELLRDIIIYAQPATSMTHTIFINQSEHQTITVTIEGNKYTEDVIMKHGTEFTVSIEADKGYTAGQLNMTSGVLVDSITIAATPAIPITFKVHVVQSPHQTIRVYYQSSIYTTDFTVDYGALVTADIEADEGYIAGTLNHTKGYVTTDITIEATPVQLKQYTLTIEEADHQRLVVMASNGTQYLAGSYTIDYGTSFTVLVIAEEGYIAGTPNMTSGTIVQDTVISVSVATVLRYTIHIVQTNNQTIIVTANNQNYISDISLPYNTEYTVSLQPDQGFEAGQLSTTGGILTKDITITATEPTRNLFWIRITEYTHQHITVTVDGDTYTDDVQLPYGTVWSATITADSGYTVGTLNLTGGTLTSDITLTSTTGDATIQAFLLTIVQSAHQTITVTTSNGDKYTKSTRLAYGVRWTASIQAETGYRPGTLNMTFGTMTGDTTVSATAAIISTVNITITQSENQTIHVYIPDIDGTDHSSSFTCDYGSSYFAQSIPDMWWNAGTLNIPATGNFIEDTTVTVTAVTQRTDYDLSITVAETTEDNYGGVGFNTSKYANPNSHTEPFGSCSPNYISDGFCVYPKPYTTKSYFFFWGESSVRGLFDYCSIVLEDDNGNTYTVGTNIPNSAFSGAGDISGTNTNASFAFTQELYEWVHARLGKHITAHLHIE